MIEKKISLLNFDREIFGENVIIIKRTNKTFGKRVKSARTDSQIAQLNTLETVFCLKQIALMYHA